MKCTMVIGVRFFNCGYTICAHILFSTTPRCMMCAIDIDHPFFRALPEFICLADGDRRELSWLETATNVIIQETSSGETATGLRLFLKHKFARSRV